jgi:hypothetical protein
MIRPSATRERFKNIVEEYGVTVSFVARALKWDKANLIKFKNGQLNISKHREIMLAEFLDKYDKQGQVG